MMNDTIVFEKLRVFVLVRPNENDQPEFSKISTQGSMFMSSSVGWVPDFKTVGPDSILCQSTTQGLKMTKGVLLSLCL